MAETLPTVLSLSDGAGCLLTVALTLLALLIYTKGAWGVLHSAVRAAHRGLRGQRSGSGGTLPAASGS